MKRFFLFFFFSSTCLAEIHYSADLAIRTDPRASNLTATVAYDYLLRGEATKETPLYSYVRVGAIAGGSPSVGAFLDYAPIAPLTISVQKSYTHRFQKSSRFDCESYQCEKNVDRTDYSIRAILGYEKIFFTHNHLWRELKTDTDSKPIYIEQEHFVVTSGFHRLTEDSSILGYMISETQQAGFIYTNNEFSEGSFRSHTASVFCRQQWGEFSITFGISEYKYEQFDIRGPAGFLTLNYDAGKKLSLF